MMISCRLESNVHYPLKGASNHNNGGEHPGVDRDGGLERRASTSSYLAGSRQLSSSHERVRESVTGRTATRLCATAFGLVAVACSGPAPSASSSLAPPESAHDGPAETPAEPKEAATSVDAVPEPTDPPDVTSSPSPNSSAVPVDGGPSDEMRVIEVEWVATMSGPSNNDEFDGVAVGLDGSVLVDSTGPVRWAALEPSAVSRSAWAPAE